MGVQLIVYVPGTALAFLSPGPHHFPHELCESPAGRRETERQLGKGVKDTLPLETEVLPVSFADIHVVVPRLQIEGEHVVVRLKPTGDLAERLVAEFWDMQMLVNCATVPDKPEFSFLVYDSQGTGHKRPRVRAPNGPSPEEVLDHVRYEVAIV